MNTKKIIVLVVILVAAALGCNKSSHDGIAGVYCPKTGGAVTWTGFADGTQFDFASGQIVVAPSGNNDIFRYAIVGGLPTIQIGTTIGAPYAALLAGAASLAGSTDTWNLTCPQTPTSYGTLVTNTSFNLNVGNVLVFRLSDGRFVKFQVLNLNGGALDFVYQIHVAH